MPPNNSIFYIIKHHSTVHTKQCLYIIPYFRVFCKRVTHIFLKIFIAVELGAFLHWLTGAYELPQAGSSLTGRLFFLHRLTRVLELPQAGSPFPGGEFFAEPQRGIRRLRTVGDVPRPAAETTPYPRRWAKRKDNLRFSFLFELLPFPYFLIWRRFPICDRSEKEYGSRVTAACLSPPFRSSQTAYCYTCGLINAECGITVPHNSLARYDRQHLRG